MARHIAIILAAGQSRRMGRPKALLPAPGGHTFLSLLVERCRRAGLIPLVVTGAHAREIAMAHPKLWRVVNRRWEQGQFSSVRVGLRACAAARRVVIHPVDAPAVRVATLRRLARAQAPAVVASYRGRAGHPISIDALTAHALRRSVAPTLKAALRALGATRVEVADPFVLQNLNTPAQLLKWGRSGRGGAPAPARSVHRAPRRRAGTRTR